MTRGASKSRKTMLVSRSTDRRSEVNRWPFICKASARTYASSWTRDLRLYNVFQSRARRTRSSTECNDRVFSDVSKLHVAFEVAARKHESIRTYTDSSTRRSPLSADAWGSSSCEEPHKCASREASALGNQSSDTISFSLVSPRYIAS